jgi:DNA-binding MarR family transcriptional regulator
MAKNNAPSARAAAPRASRAALPAEAALARKLLRERRRRDQALGSGLFAEPAWDMLLELFVAHERGEHLKVASLCAAAGTSATAAYRWILVLEKRGHVVRIGDPEERRRMHVYLTGGTARKMRSLLRSWL